MSHFKPERRPVTLAEAEAFAAGAQQRLFDLLERAHAHNAAILARYGYPCNRAPWKFRPAAEIAEPDAMEAADIVDSVGNCYRAWKSGDKAALAEAALWPGMELGPELYRNAIRPARQRAAEESNKVKREKGDSVLDWIHPIFDRAYDKLEAECRAVIGGASWRE